MLAHSANPELRAKNPRQPGAEHCESNRNRPRGCRWADKISAGLDDSGRRPSTAPGQRASSPVSSSARTNRAGLSITLTSTIYKP